MEGKICLVNTHQITQVLHYQSVFQITSDTFLALKKFLKNTSQIFVPIKIVISDKNYIALTGQLCHVSRELLMQA